MDIAEKIDALGMLCPLPVLKLRKRINGLPDGSVVELTADDPAAVIDVPHFCHESGHELIETYPRDKAQIYLIRKVG